MSFPSPNEEPFLLSICIPTWNRARCLEETLQALEKSLEGLEDRVEIVVADNASADDTPEVIRAHQGRFRHYRAIRRPYNTNSDNFWLLIKEAQGRYCWLHADDDTVYPHALPTILPHLRAGTYPYLYLNFDAYDRDLARKIVGPVVDVKADLEGSLLDFTKKFGYIHGLPFLTASIFDRRKFLSGNLEEYLRNDSYYPQCAVFLEAFGNSRCRLIADPLIKYRSFHDHLGSNVNKLYAEALEFTRSIGFVRNLELLLEKGIITTAWMGDVEERPPVGQIHTLFDTVWAHLHNLNQAWYRIPPVQLARLIAFARKIPKPNRGEIVNSRMVQRELLQSAQLDLPCIYAWRPTRILPLVSVVLTVPERADALPLLDFLTAVRRMNQRIEVVVVYASRRPDPELVEAFDAVAAPYDGTRYEPGHCLNIGLRLTRSPVVAVFAGDAALDAALVEQLVGRLLEGSAQETVKDRPLVLADGEKIPELENPEAMFATHRFPEENPYHQISVPALFAFSRFRLLDAGGFDETALWSKKSVALWDAWFRVSSWKSFLADCCLLLAGRSLLAKSPSSEFGDRMKKPRAATFLLLLRRLNRFPITNSVFKSRNRSKNPPGASLGKNRSRQGIAPLIWATLRRLRTKKLRQRIF